EKVLITLGCSDLYLAQSVDEPPKSMESSMPEAKIYYERCEQSNPIQSPAMMNLGNNCGECHSDTLITVVGPLQWKCDNSADDGN
ncbi:hypothetical protein HAX54_033383, partial [Datura stramonium]|nr:hypothetical protein [Datura stramonium]